MSQTRLILIQWISVTDNTVTGYNIYQVNGAPENTTKALLAFVAGITATEYVFTGEEGAQYQFEVRSTDGVNESPPLELFYPQGTSTYTPTTLTPTGKPMQIVRDMPYLTKDEYLNYPSGLKLNTSSPLYASGVLDTILQMASEQVNRYCRRHFNTQTIDEIYESVPINPSYPRMISVQLNEGPVQSINSVNIQVLKWFINFDLQYLQVFPEKNFYRIVPFLGGNAAGTPLPGSVLTERIPIMLWTNYTFGYDVIPNQVKLATSLYATKMIGLQENPVSAQAVRFGRNFSLQWDAKNDPLIRQAEMLLSPYRLTTYRTT